MHLKFRLAHKKKIKEKKKDLKVQIKWKMCNFINFENGDFCRSQHFGRRRSRIGWGGSRPFLDTSQPWSQRQGRQISFFALKARFVLKGMLAGLDLWAAQSNYRLKQFALSVWVFWQTNWSRSDKCYSYQRLFTGTTHWSPSLHHRVSHPWINPPLAVLCFAGILCRYRLLAIKVWYLYFQCNSLHTLKSLFLVIKAICNRFSALQKAGDSSDI